MGVSVSASALIFFISFAICLSMVFTATQAYYEDLQEAQSGNAAEYQERLNTMFSFDRSVYNGTTKTLVLNATNDGSVTIDASKMDIMVDGVLKSQNITSLVIDGYQGLIWYPATTLTVKLQGISPPARVMLCGPGGARCFTSNIQYE